MGGGGERGGVGGLYIALLMGTAHIGVGALLDRFSIVTDCDSRAWIVFKT